MIVSGGENIASPEVERVLYEHPGVLEAAVVGCSDPRWGEVPVAFVVLREGVAGDAVARQAFCRARLARFKVPRAVRFVPALPRNPWGKVLKRVLREEGRRLGMASLAEGAPGGLPGGPEAQPPRPAAP
jgi:fatty-acyl-CoA synthase